GGHWLGFPARLRDKGGAFDPEVERVTVAVFQGKEADGATRAGVAEAWWDWLAHRNGLEKQEDVDAGRKARDAFWAKAKAGHAPGAWARRPVPARRGDARSARGGAASRGPSCLGRPPGRGRARR